MDTGGSMAPYADLCDRLFSAATQVEHFKDFQHYFFHNCIYEHVYQDMWNSKATPTDKLFSNFHSGYKVVLVGDARMAYSELFDKYGCIDYYYSNDKPGIEWLQRIKEHFPTPSGSTPHRSNIGATPRLRRSAKLFPMYELTLDGLKDAIKALTTKVRQPAAALAGLDPTSLQNIVTPRSHSSFN